MQSAPDTAEPPVLFAPIVTATQRVEPGWIDFNGHMNMAYYVVMFDRAADEGFALLGLGPAYLETRNASTFTAEIHVRYLRELTRDTAVRTTMQLIASDEKRIHAYFEIRHLEESWVAATCEQMFLHVDMATRKVAPFPADILTNLAAMQAAHGRMADPPALGRVIGVP